MLDRLSRRDIDPTRMSKRMWRKVLAQSIEETHHGTFKFPGEYFLNFQLITEIDALAAYLDNLNLVQR